MNAPATQTEMATPPTFSGRLAIQDLVLPIYRRTIYEALARQVAGGLGVFTGVSSRTHGVVLAHDLAVERHDIVRNHHFLRGPAEMIWQPGLSSFIRSFEPDVFLASGNPRLLSTRVARRTARRRGIPVLGWGLGTLMMGSGLAGLRNSGRRMFFQAFDGIVAYSSAAKDEYVSCGVAEQRVFVVHNAASPRPKHALPKRAALLEQRPRVVFVGRLYEGKRLELLFKAARMMDREVRPVIEVVGDGPGLEAFKAQASSIAQDAEDIVFSGALHHEALEAAFRRADLFVLPGMGGLAIQEAMSWGLPVVSAEGDGTQFDLVRSENGWLMEHGSVQSLNDILVEAFSDIGKLRTMGAESYRIVCEEINLEIMINEMIDAVSSIHAIVHDGSHA